MKDYELRTYWILGKQALLFGREMVFIGCPRGPAWWLARLLAWRLGPWRAKDVVAFGGRA